MQPIVTTNLLALVLLIALIASGSLGLLRSFFIAYARRKNFVIYKVSGDGLGAIKDVLKFAAPPFSFEIAVSQLGKEKAYYVTLPLSRAKRFEGVSGASKIDDYEIYHPGGITIGGYAFSEDPLSVPEVEKIDFSEINEIGEGAVLQFVVHKKSRGKLIANLRAVVSAPSSYQAKEVLSNIKKSLPGVQFREVGSVEFVDSVNNRRFAHKEAVGISL